MPVHNALPYLDAAIRSVVEQSFADFEFVILNDASSDGSGGVLRDWAKQDKRIRLIEVKEKLGPVASSGRVASDARAPLVARMDADDVSLPQRFVRQLEVLDQNPAIGVVGCLADTIDATGRKVRLPDLWRLTRTSAAVPFPHGAMMYRSKVFDAVGGYRSGCDFWEDQDLITRMASVSEVVALPETLYRVRQTHASTRAIADQERIEHSFDEAYRLIRGVPPGKGKIEPTVFVALGSVTLWAGGRPRLFRRFLKRAEVGANWRSFASLVWTAWATTSPGTLRRVLLALLRARNMIAAKRLSSRAPVPWKRPPPMSQF
jgi:glycosyltransferase involved in cell wall biosynthesis